MGVPLDTVRAVAIVLVACKPTPPPELTMGWSVALPTMYSCTADEGGVLRCWGDNAKGVIGDGTFEDRLSPTVIEGIAPVARVVGDGPVCALTTNGSVECWGERSWGALGDGADETRTTPTPVVDLPHAVAIDSAGHRTCAVTTKRAVHCWGREHVPGTNDDRSVLRATKVDVPDAVEVGIGYAHACLRTEDGVVWCWGHNKFGQLGDGTTTDSGIAVEVADVVAVQLAIGNFHSCARLEDGSATCWGRNTDPRGEKVSPVESDTINTRPRRIRDLSGIAQLVAGDTHTCARTSADEVWCWGDNEGGQLGLTPSERIQWFPVQLISLSGARDVSAGAWRTCARRSGDALECVGRTFVGRENGKARTKVMLPPPA